MAGAACGASDDHTWSPGELRRIEGLSIAGLGPPPLDRSNALADDPAAARLGHRLFYDAGLSLNGQVACAVCHQPELYFTDGLPRARGIGEARRGAPTVVGAAWSPWLFWDGRADSLWSQALGPLEDPAEHGLPRVDGVRRLGSAHRVEYEAVFGPLPDIGEEARFPPGAAPRGDAEAVAAWEGMDVRDRAAVTSAFVNAGKAIAAFERRLAPGRVALDDYIDGALADDRRAMATALDAPAARGLRLFVGRAGCHRCHFGPRLTNDDFHNTGLPLRPPPSGTPGIEHAAAFDSGRADGVAVALRSPFGCFGQHSDAAPDDPGACPHVRYARADGHDLWGAFKVPSLRGVADTAPYMHDGRFATLREVVLHYDAAPLPANGVSDLRPLGLADDEVADLVAFLETLTGAVDADPDLLEPPR